MAQELLPKIHAGLPVFTNAHGNRQAATQCFKAGMSPAQIAAEWPEVWRLNPTNGLISQKYDYELADGSGRYETNRLITSESVHAAIKRFRAGR